MAQIKQLLPGLPKLQNFSAVQKSPLHPVLYSGCGRRPLQPSHPTGVAQPYDQRCRSAACGAAAQAAGQVLNLRLCMLAAGQEEALYHALSQLCSLTWLRLWLWPVDDEEEDDIVFDSRLLEVLAALPRLNNLQLNNYIGVQRFTALRALRSLDLGVGTILDDVALPHLTHLAAGALQGADSSSGQRQRTRIALRSLKLLGAREAEAGVSLAAVAAWSPPPALTSLGVNIVGSRNGLSPSDVRALVTFTNLRCLDVSFRGCDNALINRSLAQLTKLTSLEIAHVSATHELGFFMHLTNLVTVEAYGFLHTTDNGLMPVVALPRLQILRIADMQLITPKFFAALLAGGAASLWRVDMDNCKLITACGCR